MTTLRELEDQYDPEHDIAPGIPLVSWTDSQLIEIIKKLERRIAKLEKQLAAPNPLDQALNEGDGVYRP